MLSVWQVGLPRFIPSKLGSVDETFTSWATAQRNRRQNMQRFNSFNFRNQVAAAICATFLTITCFTAMLAPVSAAQEAMSTASVSAPLA
jgi:hypothetical protein